MGVPAGTTGRQNRERRTMDARDRTSEQLRSLMRYASRGEGMTLSAEAVSMIRSITDRGADEIDRRWTECRELAAAVNHLLMLWVSDKGMDWNAVDKAVGLLDQGGYPITLAVAERAGLTRDPRR